MHKITEKKIIGFGKYLTAEEKSKATKEKYIRDVKAFSEWLKNTELSKAKLLEYKKYLIENYAPASVNSMISSINRFFDYAKEFSLKIKTLKIQKRIFAKKEKELSKEEYTKLLKAAKSKGNRKLYLLMQTICACGIRVSELKYITVNAIKKGQAVINLKGKIRVVLLPHNLCGLLKKYAAEKKIKKGSIFITRSGNPLDRSNIWKLMKNLCKAAGVSKEKVFPHNLRHLFAKTFYSAEKDIVRLADILGHSNVNTTRIYIMENSDNFRKQLQKLGLLLC